MYGSVSDPMAAEMQLSCIIRTILIDVLYHSVSVICCDLELHMLHHSFRRLQSLRLTLRRLTASLQVVRTSLQTGSPSANSKSPLILHSHMACACQDETGDLNRQTLEKILGCSKISSVYKMHVNVPIFSLWFRVRSWDGGCWPFELSEKYETAASLWLPIALLLCTQMKTAINLSGEKKSLL